MPAYYEFSYDLTEEEIISGLKISGIYKSTGKRAVIETVVLAVMFLIFTVSFIISPQWFDIAMALLCLIIILALNLVPRIDMRRQAAKGEKKVMMRVYPDKLYVYSKQGTTPIDLHDKHRITYSNKLQLITLVIKTGGILVIPVRAIPEENRGKVVEILTERAV